MGKDLYKILGISRSADDKEIRAAYRALAKRYHPDTGAGSSEEKFREIQDAYEGLGDPARRAAYDRESRWGVHISTPTEHVWRSKWQEHKPRGDPSHLDLSDIFPRPRAEPIGRRHRPTSHAQYAQLDPWSELAEILRIFERFDEPDW